MTPRRRRAVTARLVLVLAILVGLMVLLYEVFLRGGQAPAPRVTPSVFVTLASHQ